jgi:hypothetical protein
VICKWGDDDSDAQSLFLLACGKLLRGRVSLIPVEKNVSSRPKDTLDRLGESFYIPFIQIHLYIHWPRS